MKTFCFTVDDNIRFLKEITERQYGSLFEHPYLAVYKRLHDELGLKVQLNLFYRTIEGDFNLSQVTDKYYNEWKQNADWLKLSFHSQWESMKPYEFSGYDEVYTDCKAVHEQIVRFASPDALADTTTVHFCLATSDGLRALADNHVKGLLGLFGNDVMPRTSYELAEEHASLLRAGKMVVKNDMVFAPIDVILNVYSTERILELLSQKLDRDAVWVMIHEQFFYEDYPYYQPEFEDKLRQTFSFLCKNGYHSCFFEEKITV